MNTFEKLTKSFFTLSSPLKSHSDYRADIDGLRAIAVALVVGFHAFPKYFPGGFIGVDIFFVISGYLISGIIFWQLREDRFSFFDFYIKRVNRIFPALITVLVISIFLGNIFLFTTEKISFNQSLTAAIAFVSNLFFYNESNYFDSIAETKPLLHLWSLGIEEQFYILWPILLIFLWKKPLAKIWIVVSLILVSMYINISLVNTNQAASFYLPFSRFWELLLGSGLAYLSIYNEQSILSRFSNKKIMLTRNIIAFSGMPLQ